MNKVGLFLLYTTKGAWEFLQLSLISTTSVVGHTEMDEMEKNRWVFFFFLLVSLLEGLSYNELFIPECQQYASWLSAVSHTKCTAMHWYIPILSPCISQYLAALCPCHHLFLPKFLPFELCCLSTLSTTVCVLYKWNVSHCLGTRGIDKH